MFEARVVRVLIVSPGDVAQLRDLAARTVWDWNAAGQSERRGIVALPMRWEYDVAAQQSPDGSDGQMLLNRDMVDVADIVIAIFHTRLGTATPRARSGSAEEIERSREHTLGTHVFVSDAPVPRNMDVTQRTQLEMLQAYEDELQENGLVGRFTTDAQLERGIRLALERDIGRFAKNVAAATPRSWDPPDWLRRMGDLGQVYPTPVLRMSSERLTRAFERQGGAVATYIEDEVTLSTSAMSGYVNYDVHRRTTFTWSKAPAPATVTVAIAPVLVARPGVPASTMLMPASDRDRMPWAYQFWPPLNVGGDWASLRNGLSIELRLGQSKNERAERYVELLELSQSSSPGLPETQQNGMVGGSGPSSMTLTGTLELADDWDVVDLRIRNLVHPMSMRAMHFYAGDFCTGTWDITVTGNHPAVVARITAVAGADVQMSTRRPTVDLGHARVRATDVAVFPDDAVVISLNDRD